MKAIERGEHIGYTRADGKRVDIWDRIVSGVRNGYLCEYFDEPGNPVAMLHYAYLYQAEAAALAYTGTDQILTAK